MVGAALVGTETALGVIPTGTGNDFARFIGINRKKPIDAVAALVDPDIRAIDAVRVSGGGREERFINVAGAGFDSEVNETANNMKWKAQGTAKYVAAVVGTLRRFTPAQFEVTVDGEHRSLSGMLIAVGNGESYGGGMRVAAGASLTDGQLEVCVVGGMSRSAFLRAFPKVFRGTHVTHPKVTMLRGARVEISSDRPFDVYADGERSVPLPAVFEVLPGSLKVAFPRDAPQR
jgi:diacylglycerol kinase (ATP)